MMLTSCSTTSKVENSIVPDVVIPTKQERVILRAQLPDFYIRFAEQQRQILIAKNPANINGSIQKRIVHAIGLNP